MELLRKFWAGWKAFGHFMGNLLARVVLSIFYFTIFVPFAAGVRWLSDPLKLKPAAGDLWQARKTGDQTVTDVERQY
jgi:hypothetical protein